MQLENIALKAQLQDFEHTLKLFLSNRDIIKVADQIPGKDRAYIKDFLKSTKSKLKKGEEKRIMANPASNILTEEEITVLVDEFVDELEDYLANELNSWKLHINSTLAWSNLKS